MTHLRTYGDEPFTVVVVHGGPGAPGSVALMAANLSKHYGVLEPMQTKLDLMGQVNELRDVIELHCDGAINLIGHSWGAWLAYIMAAKYPKLVRKLIMVGSGPFKVEYLNKLESTRTNRMNKLEKAEFHEVLSKLNTNDTLEKDKNLIKLSKIVDGTDNYALREVDESKYFIKQDGSMYQNVWNEAAEMRKSGELLSLSECITCPVLAIHGNYDPHPSEGVKEPLESRLKNFKFKLLTECGHSPWKEKYAFEEFYKTVIDFIGLG